MGAVGLRSLGLADLGMSLGWVCEPMNVQNRVSDLLRLIHTTDVYTDQYYSFEFFDNNYTKTRLHSYHTV